MTSTIKKRRLLYLEFGDWTWWVWLITAILLIVGLVGHPTAFIGAMVVTAVQGFIFFSRDRSLWTFPVQLRVSYLLLLLIAYPRPMRWLYWLPALGTTALVVFGYCLLARLLSLLPWNSREAYSFSRLQRTFLSAPDLDQVTDKSLAVSCAGGLCTIEAQVARPNLPENDDVGASHSRASVSIDP